MQTANCWFQDWFHEIVCSTPFAFHSSCEQLSTYKQHAFMRTAGEEMWSGAGTGRESQEQASDPPRSTPTAEMEHSWGRFKGLATAPGLALKQRSVEVLALLFSLQIPTSICECKLVWGYVTTCSHLIFTTTSCRKCCIFPFSGRGVSRWSPLGPWSPASRGRAVCLQNPALPNPLDGLFAHSTFLSVKWLQREFIVIHFSSFSIKSKNLSS